MIDKTNVWYVESAVAEYPYSGTIGINLISQSVEHNLMVESVGNVRKESLALNSAAKSIHLFLEASSGEFAVVRSPHFVALQSIFIFVFCYEHYIYMNRYCSKFLFIYAVVQGFQILTSVILNILYAKYFINTRSSLE